MTLGAPHALAPFLLEDADLRAARLAGHDEDHARVGDKGRPSDDFTAVFFDEQDLSERQLRAGLAGRTVDEGDAARGHLVLPAAGLNDCEHNRHLCKRDSLLAKWFTCKGLGR